MIKLFDRACLYDRLKDETILYGQFNVVFNKIQIENTTGELVLCNSRPDFYIKIQGHIAHIESIIFLNNTTRVTELENITLCFPFENCDLHLHSSSAIISTMCKDYSHRLDEWIRYNLKLGFSGIVIFNNDGNKSTHINEPTDNCIHPYSTEEICKKYKGKVWMIEFPYSPFFRQHYDSIQRIALHIGVNAFRDKCRNIALIDADEFIYLPKDPSMKIEVFLQNHSTTTIRSNILTNKNNNDVLNNNILELATYVGEDKYTKAILHTDSVRLYEFIVTPHNHDSEKILNKTDIIYYHCWMNNRCKYNPTMHKIDNLTI
jgi:hypothetical protein